MTPLRTSAAGSLLATTLLGAVLTWPAGATAAVDPKNPCNLQGWYVNDDEAARAPERKITGFVFEPADLVHHSADVALKDLEPGIFTAAPTPDQPSFFSVEVRDATTDAYGTLRWNKVTGLWTITIGAGGPAENPATAGTYSAADPTLLLAGKVTKWGPFTKATKVISFGVGYTASPPGTVVTTVTSVSFQGKAYDLKCQAPVDPSPSPTKTVSPTPSSTKSPTASPTKTGTASPTSTASSTATPRTTSSPSSTPQRGAVVGGGNGEASGGDSLPTTGGNGSLPYVLGAGAGVLLAGAALIWAVRRWRRVS